ncbi:MAG: hypothetical protein IJM66_07990 [Muribaculaceae bacterium]|nr:hypothetical protein [Muribaculaceae bacterium]
MTRKITLALLAMLAMCLTANADPIKIKGVYNNNRYDDHADHWYSQYVGWNSALGRAIFVVENGIYAMQVDQNTVSTPVKEPDVVISDFFSNGQFTNNDLALWATNFNLMYGNSGAVNANGVITTVTSRTESEGVDSTNIFAVRHWNAETGDLLNASNEYYPKDAYLESAGMAVNPVDGKVYGLFYLTDVPLPEEIVNDPDFFGDSIDSGYAICTIDLESMQVTPITQGLYYENFVTFAINREGRAFALTSGATAGYEGEDGKMYDINGNLTGAQLYEFDLASGLVVATKGATGYCSQAKRQSACFSMKDPSKMYWNGFYNSGMGYNAYGNWGPLPDSDWKNNGKYDTALYEVDINTGETTRIAKITNRFSFSCMWVVEDDSPVVAGDVNGDGLVTSIDITVLYNYLLLGDDTHMVNGDQNQDGQVTSNDVTTVYNILLGNQ